MAIPFPDPYRLISDNMQDVVSLHAATGETLFASPSIKRVVGLTPARVLGMTPFARIHPDDLPQMYRVLHTIIDGSTPTVTYEFRFRHLRGYYVWLEAIMVPAKQADGSVQHYHASSRDISRRRQIRQALRNSEERFRQLATMSADWFWELDEQFRFSFHSHQTTTFTMMPSSALMGKTRWELWPEALTSAEWEEHKALLVARQPFYNLMLKRFDPATGQLIGYSLISGEPYYDEDGIFKGYRGIGKDITERKRAELALASRTAELALANRRLEEEAKRRLELERNVLMAIEMELTEVGLELHDDLGQDLTGIALLTKSLEQKLRERGLVEAGDASRILEIVNRTIKHTRMISHGLSPYIAGAEGLVSALAQLAGDIDMIGAIQCEADLDRHILVPDEVVARSLYRIAQESINNALKHSQAKRIVVRLYRRGANVHLLITDDGRNARQEPVVRPTDTKFYSLRHRTSVIGAQLTVDRPRSGGTRIHVIWHDPSYNQSALPNQARIPEAI